jgi:5-methylcytosine-specific restriction protein A
MVFDWYRRRKRAFGNKRSPQWGGVRKAFLKTHGSCVACGSKDHLEVHHIVPFHMVPSKELQQSNLVTLCQSKSHNDHLIFGHLLDFHAMNVKVVTDAKNYHTEVAKRKIGKGAAG